MLGYGGEAPTYTATARALHWTTAALVIVMIPIGIVMANFSLGPAGDVLYDIHRSFGAVLIPLVLARLAYRLANPPPPLPDDIPAIQQLAANAHALGALHSSYRARFRRMDRDVGLPRADQGVLAVRAAADLAGGSAFSEKMFGVHRFLGIALALLICLHVGAALFHHFVRKDEF